MNGRRITIRNYDKTNKRKKKSITKKNNAMKFAINIYFGDFSQFSLADITRRLTSLQERHCFHHYHDLFFYRNFMETLMERLSWVLWRCSFTFISADYYYNKSQLVILRPLIKQRCLRIKNKLPSMRCLSSILKA